MIIMRLALDNLFAFEGFEIDMSYPKKAVRSSIQDEFLEGYPNFRYKKVNIIMGSNASGKTTLGKALMNILNFIARKDYAIIDSMICDASRPASFLVDFIVKERKLNRVILDILPQPDDKRKHVLSYDSERIMVRDSYQSCAGRLDKKGRTIIEPDTGLDQIERLDWCFSYPDSNTADWIPRLNDDDVLVALNAVLRTLDPTISEVRKLEGVKDPGFVIVKAGKEIILQNGVLTNPDIFSSGTKEGVQIAIFLAAMIGSQGPYYCDERFSYIHSSIEARIFGIMVSRLRREGQLFFTTHNETMMELNLPKHSFTFLVRKDGKITAIYANQFVQKASDNLRNAVENDVIHVIPDDHYLDALEV